VARVMNAVHDPQIFPGTSKLYSTTCAQHRWSKGKSLVAYTYCMTRNKKHLKEGHQGAVQLVDANLFQGTESLAYYPVVFIQILTCQMPLVGSSWLGMSELE
jgi:hypothetical protein